MEALALSKKPTTIAVLIYDRFGKHRSVGVARILATILRCVMVANVPRITHQWAKLAMPAQLRALRAATEVPLESRRVEVGGKLAGAEVRHRPQLARPCPQVQREQMFIELRGLASPTTCVALHAA